MSFQVYAQLWEQIVPMNIWLYLCPSLPQPPSLLNKETRTCSPFCPLWKGKENPSTKKPSTVIWRGLTFQLMDQLWMNARQLLSQTREFSRAKGFLRGNRVYLMILACLHCPASHNSRGSCSHLKGSTALLHTEKTHYHWTGIELTKLQTSALNQASSPSTVNKERQTPPKWQCTNLKYLRNRTNPQEKCSLDLPIVITYSPLDNQSQA